MRVAEYKQTGTRTEEITIPAVYDDEGNVIENERVETVERPVMSMVYRDMTPEEEAEALEQQAQAEKYERTRPRTVEERIEMLDNSETGEIAEIRAALVELADIIMEGI